MSVSRFGSSTEQRLEANLVGKLRGDGGALISLVAELEGRSVAPIMFSRMWSNRSAGLLPAVALAPMACLPKHLKLSV